MKITSGFILLAFFVFIMSAQSLRSQNNYTEAALFNIGIGSVFSGIGAVINKEPQERFGKVIFKGMAQGALGGYLVFESKVIAGRIAKQKNLTYGWPAKFVNSAGTSIIENAASNRNFWEQWNLNIGFNRIEFHTKERLQVKYKVQPVAMFLTISNAINYSIDLKNSLKIGEFVFTGNKLKSSFSNNPEGPAGQASATSMVINREYLNDYRVYAHELIHILQYYDFNVFNSYLNKPLKQFKNGSRFFNKIDKIFHYDLNYFLFHSVYFAENFKVPNSQLYEKNYFELEADFYSAN